MLKLCLFNNDIEKSIKDLELHMSSVSLISMSMYTFLSLIDFG